MHDREMTLAMQQSTQQIQHRQIDEERHRDKTKARSQPGKPQVIAGVHGLQHVVDDGDGEADEDRPEHRLAPAHTSSKAS